MNEQILWKFVQKAREHTSSNYKQTQYLTEAMTGWSTQNLITFKQLYWKLLKYSFSADLWAAAYVINKGCSEQDFLYFRNWLILQGQATFKKVVQDPEYLAEYLHLPLQEPLQSPDLHDKIALVLAYKSAKSITDYDYKDEEGSLKGEFWKNDSDIIDKVPLLCQIMGWGNEVPKGEWKSDYFPQYKRTTNEQFIHQNIFF